MATGAAGTRRTDGGVCTCMLRAGPVSANLSPPAGVSLESRFQLERPETQPPHPPHLDLPRGGAAGRAGSLSSAKGLPESQLTTW